MKSRELGHGLASLHVALPGWSVSRLTFLLSPAWWCGPVCCNLKIQKNKKKFEIGVRGTILQRFHVLLLLEVPVFGRAPHPACPEHTALGCSGRCPLVLEDRGCRGLTPAGR